MMIMSDVAKACWSIAVAENVQSYSKQSNKDLSYKHSDNDVGYDDDNNNNAALVIMTIIMII